MFCFTAGLSCQSLCVCVCYYVSTVSVNRVSRLIPTPFSLSRSSPPLFFGSSILRSAFQPGFEEINPEWKTSLERRKKIKGSLAWRVTESWPWCWHRSTRWIQFSDLWHVLFTELYSYLDMQPSAKASKLFLTQYLCVCVCVCGIASKSVCVCVCLSYAAAESVFDGFGPIVMTAVTACASNNLCMSPHLMHDKW